MIEKEKIVNYARTKLNSDIKLYQRREDENAFRLKAELIYQPLSPVHIIILNYRCGLCHFLGIFTFSIHKLHIYLFKHTLYGRRS